ncbi:MAG: hypothetical protein CMI54_03490 [Parcubacteria group bacterium]|mgnify:CR=1 FL=1|jgi:uncharacterized protein YcsI (UPF0317 family)|nr:hypothetical protein [Parcubacteria group bacterium]|tara:strand:- start:6245 stop:6472 length:228 start_codon:yes stop_codon:yes gene_type:complete
MTTKYEPKMAYTKVDVCNDVPLKVEWEEGKLMYWQGNVFNTWNDAYIVENKEAFLSLVSFVESTIQDHEMKGEDY